MEWMIPELVESMNRSSFLVGFLLGWVTMLLPIGLVALVVWLKREVKTLTKELDEALEEAE